MATLSELKRCHWCLDCNRVYHPWEDPESCDHRGHRVQPLATRCTRPITPCFCDRCVRDGTLGFSS